MDFFIELLRVLTVIAAWLTPHWVGTNPLATAAWTCFLGLCLGLSLRFLWRSGLIGILLLALAIPAVL